MLAHKSRGRNWDPRQVLGLTPLSQTGPGLKMGRWESGRRRSRAPCRGRHRRRLGNLNAAHRFGRPRCGELKNCAFTEAQLIPTLPRFGRHLVNRAAASVFPRRLLDFSLSTLHYAPQITAGRESDLSPGMFAWHDLLTEDSTAFAAAEEYLSAHHERKKRTVSRALAGGSKASTRRRFPGDGCGPQN